MKRLLILFILNALLVGSVHAYVPLVREGVKWVNYGSYTPQGSDQSIGFNYVYEFGGDTTVNQVQYKKLYMYGTELLGHVSFQQYDSRLMLVALMREEGHKVY